MDGGAAAPRKRGAEQGPLPSPHSSAPNPNHPQPLCRVPPSPWRAAQPRSPPSAGEQPRQWPPTEVLRLVIKLQAFVLLSIPCLLQRPPHRLPASCILCPQNPPLLIQGPRSPYSPGAIPMLPAPNRMGKTLRGVPIPKCRQEHPTPAAGFGVQGMSPPPGGVPIAPLVSFLPRQCFTIEKLGRRPLIITGFCAMGVCLAGITLCLLLQVGPGHCSWDMGQGWERGPGHLNEGWV